MMWPFKWKLSACTYTWCYLFVKIFDNEIWNLVEICLWPHLAVKGLRAAWIYLQHAFIAAPLLDNNLCFKAKNANTTAQIERTVFVVSGKALTFSLNSTLIIRTPVNADKGHLFPVQSRDSHRKTTSLVRTLHRQLCAVINLPFKGKRNFSWQHVDISSAEVQRIGWIVDVNFELF